MALAPWGLVGQKILVITINRPKTKGELEKKIILDFPHFLGKNGKTVNEGQFFVGAKKKCAPTFFETFFVWSFTSIGKLKHIKKTDRPNSVFLRYRVF